MTSSGIIRNVFVRAVVLSLSVPCIIMPAGGWSLAVPGWQRARLHGNPWGRRSWPRRGSPECLSTLQWPLHGCSSLLCCSASVSIADADYQRLLLQLCMEVEAGWLAGRVVDDLWPCRLWLVARTVCCVISSRQLRLRETYLLFYHHHHCQCCRLMPLS